MAIPPTSQSLSVNNVGPCDATHRIMPRVFHSSSPDSMNTIRWKTLGSPISMKCERNVRGPLGYVQVRITVLYWLSPAFMMDVARAVNRIWYTRRLRTIHHDILIKYQSSNASEQEQLSNELQVDGFVAPLGDKNTVR